MKTVLQSVPKGPACVIGADIPDISRKLVWKAFEQLGSNQAVFGPAPDGGFWLAGFSHPQKMPAATFRTVRWSSRHALNDSIQSLGQVPGDDLSLQGKIGFIDSLDDVDTLEDLNRIKARSRASA